MDFGNGEQRCILNHKNDRRSFLPQQFQRFSHGIYSHRNFRLHAIKYKERIELKRDDTKDFLVAKRGKEQNETVAIRE